MKFKKSPIIIIIIILGISLSYVTFSAFFSQPTRAKGLVGHWSLSDEDEVMGTEKITNGDFSDGSTSWVKNGGGDITVTSGEAVLDSDVINHVFQTETTTAGKRYRVTFDAYKTGNNVILTFSGVSSYWGADQITYYTLTSSSGDLTSTKTNYSLDFTASATRSWIYFKENNGIGGSLYIDNVSLREIHAADLTPNTNNGTNYGGEYTTDRNGQSNKAMDFDGGTDYIDVADFDETALNGGGTVSFWLNNDVGENITILGTGDAHDGSLTEGWVVGWRTDDRINFNNMGTTEARWASQVLSTDTWYHFVVSYDTQDFGTKPLMYVDGKSGSVTTNNGGSGTSVVGTAGLAIGAATPPTRNFNGSLQDVRIYNRVLSAEEITELYESYNPKIKLGAKRKGLVGEWSLGEEQEVVGVDLMSGWDFTSGWTGAGGASIDDNNTFSAGANPHGIYNTLGFTSNKRYRLEMSGTKTSAGEFQIRPGTSGSSISSTSDTSFNYDTIVTWKTIAGSGDFYFKHYSDSSVANIDTLVINEIKAGDSTPNANNGIIYGAIYTTDRNSQSNKALSFNGTSDYINIDGVVADVANDTQGTWMAWVKPDDGHPTNTSYLISFGDTNINEELALRLQTSGYILALAKKNTVNQWVLTTDNMIFTDGGSQPWTHIALVQNSTSPIIYINGIAVAQTESYGTDITAWNSDFSGIDNSLIGALLTTNSVIAEYFDGSISNVKIYNRALSAAEILDIYDDYNPVIKIGSLKKGLIGHWSMDDVDGKSTTVIANRVAGVGGDGTMTSMTFAGNETTDRHGQTRALDFDSTTDYLDLASTRVFGGSEEDTLAFWLKWDSYTAKMGIMCANSAGTTKNYLQRYWGAWRFENNDGDDALSLATGVDTGDYTWHHYSMIFHNDKSVDMYVDGVIASTGSFVNSDAVYLRYIGPGYSVDDGSTYPRLNGDMQDLRIYNRALSAEEIEMLYESY